MGFRVQRFGLCSFDAPIWEAGQEFTRRMMLTNAYTSSSAPRRCLSGGEKGAEELALSCKGPGRLSGFGALQPPILNLHAQTAKFGASNELEMPNSSTQKNP